LCGMIDATAGNAVIGGHRLDTDGMNAKLCLGYCPQHDILWDDLTIAEHLSFFFRLTGYPSSSPLHVHVMNLVEKVGLADHMHKRAKELSGGMKRRLSIANAIVGDPSLLLLDEPTTGLDPESRREVWDILNDASRGRATLVSTHSMDEADLLCDRIGIMSRGRLVSLGNQQYLKSRYGNGYSLTLTVDSKREMMAREFIQSLYPNARLEGNFAGMLSYLVPFQDIDLATLFERMSKESARYGIKEWGVNQTSLEAVFLSIVQRDEPKDGDEGEQAAETSETKL